MSSTPSIPTPFDVIQNVEEASYHGLPPRRTSNRNDYDSGFTELAPISAESDAAARDLAARELAKKKRAA